MVVSFLNLRVIDSRISVFWRFTLKELQPINRGIFSFVGVVLRIILFGVFFIIFCLHSFIFSL